MPAEIGRHSEVTRPLTERMVDLLAPAPGQCDVLVSDLSARMIDAAKEQGNRAGAGVDFATPDVTALDLPDAGVDGLI